MGGDLVVDGRVGAERVVDVRVRVETGGFLGRGGIEFQDLVSMCLGHCIDNVGAPQ